MEIANHDRCNNYITTPKLTSENFPAKLKQANLTSKSDITNFVNKTDVNNKLLSFNNKKKTCTC